MAKFCGKCGSKLDEDTGLCPNCDADKLKNPESQEGSFEMDEESSFTPKPQLSKKEIRKQKKQAKKRARKDERASWSLKQKIKRNIFKLLLTVSLLGILISGVVGVFEHFDIVHIQYIHKFMEMVGIEYPSINSDSESSLYIPTEDSIQIDEETGTVYINNTILIFFKTGTEKDEIDRVIKSINGVVVGSIPIIDQYQVRINSCSLDELKSICECLKENDSVFDAIYDKAFEVDSNVIPDDPWKKTLFRKEEWSEKNPEGSNWWIEAIEAPTAWSTECDLETIKVGIVDNGFDTGHEDLKNKIKYVSPVNNRASHGTHVAGIIGAEANNQKGITGIVWKCELLTYDWELNTIQKVVDSVFGLEWSTFNQILGGTVVLVEKGAKVINFSVGQTASMSGTTRSDEEVNYNGYYASLYLNALLARGYDFVIVQSAGNGNVNNESVDAVYNGIYASINEDNCVESVNVSAEDIINRIIVVGAAQNDGNNNYSQAYWSNAGERVDICAPGKDIYSTIPGGLWGKYGNMSGTSMATPVVTGIVSLVWSANSALSGADIKQIVCDVNNTKYEVVDNTSDKHPLVNTYRLVNATLSLEAALNYVPQNDGSLNNGDNSSYVLPPDVVEYDGHYYYLYTGGIASTYEEAAQYCISKGGYLATLTSKEENDFVYSYILQQGCESAYFGLSDSVSEGYWEWCTGEPLYYTNWHNGEPNGENSNEDYALFYYKYSDGSWNDGDFSGRTVNAGNAFICEWGDYSSELTKVPGGEKTSGERNIVLTLDISGSMSGTPMEETKRASTNFINTVLEQDAGIGIVTYDDISNIASGFSADRAVLQEIVSGLYDGGGTNIEAGLRDAQWMLEKTNSQKKIIVLMSDGEPNNGLVDEDLIAYADEIKKSGTIIYTIGFFESLSERSYAQYLMESIASDGYHYEVASADELAFFFEDMADQINGQKYIYVRIACPVDVSVTFDGETLDSSEENFNSRTSFGTLTFEENREEMASDMDDRVKVLRLKEGAEYNLKLTGTGHGIMNYTIGFMDENGDYSDLRRFENVKITRRTRIDTIAANSDDSILNIDEDGDGKYDIKLRAEENGYGEEVTTYDWIIYVIISAVVFIVLDIIVIMLYTKYKKKKGE